MNKLLIAIAIASLSPIAYSQVQQSEIDKSLESYFKMERENISLHFNKQEYLTGENVWLKGYVTKKQDKLPMGATTNVFINLLNADGSTVSSTLFYAENGTFNGNISVPENLATGMYYVRAYTNFMNNFREDESSVYEISVVNPSSKKYVTRAKFDYSSADATFFPEGGVLLDDAANTVAVRISDCNGNGSAATGELKDAKGSVVGSFTTDAHGYGRFEMHPGKNGPVKATCKIGDNIVEKTLPAVAFKGVSMSVNNYAFKDKAIVTLHTNNATLAEVKDKTFTLVIQQGAHASYADVKLNDVQQIVAIPANSIPDGICTIFLVDANKRKLAERVLFKPYRSENGVQLEVSQKRSDSIIVRGISPLRLANLSVSVLPLNASEPMSDVDAQTEINAYITSTLPDPKHYLNDFSRKKQYELDNFLITAEPKYKWENIVGAAPENKFSFDQGLAIKGTINAPASLASTHKAQMNSFAFGINETTTINEKNEFVFDRVVATDSTSINFSVADAKGNIPKYKIVLQLLNNKREFFKPFERGSFHCPDVLFASTDDASLSGLVRGELLDEVTVKAKQKEKLDAANQLRYNNGMAQGFKINPQLEASYHDVLGFIRMHGYNVITSGANVQINKQFTRTFMGSASPAIFIDDAPLSDFSLLLNYGLGGVDEIYINKNGYGGGSTGPNGIIRIYTKTPTDNGYGKPKTNWQNFVITRGYGQMKPYAVPDYADTRSEAFLRYGTIGWIHDVNIDKGGFFKFAFANLQQQKVKLVIEGIDSDGNVISEVKILDVN